MVLSPLLQGVSPFFALVYFVTVVLGEPLVGCETPLTVVETGVFVHVQVLSFAQEATANATIAINIVFFMVLNFNV